jgi:GNAT superfamily N-acetyltransferase
MPMEIRNEPFLLSDDPARLDLDAICGFLSQTYWAKHRPRELVAKSIRHSVCVGVYHDDRQVAFARAITDRATFAYLADVFVLEPYRRRGLARWMVESLLAHPELKHLRRWCLLTRDAHALYRPFGFGEPQQMEDHMERLQPCLPRVDGPELT